MRRPLASKSGSGSASASAPTTRKKRQRNDGAELRNGRQGVTRSRRVDKGKGKARSVVDDAAPERDADDTSDHIHELHEEEEDEEADEHMSSSRAGPSTFSARVMRGWETRRARRAETVARQEELVHCPLRPDGAIGSVTHHQIEDPSAQLETPLPTSDLLLALQHHASAFYGAYDLLLEPSDTSRSRAWGSKKRLMLLRDASGRSTTGISQSRSKSASTRIEDRDDEEDELDDDGDDVEANGGEGGGDAGGIRIKSEHGPDSIVDQHGELVQLKTGSRAWADGRKSRSKGKYKLRDMRKSLDGSALMALGILTQEMVIRKLHEAGYRPRSRRPYTKRGGDHPAVPQDGGVDDDSDAMSSSGEMDSWNNALAEMSEEAEEDRQESP